LNQAASLIAAAAVEQSAGIEQISRNVESVSSVSKESAMEAQDLAINANKVKDVVSNIEEQLDRFTVG